MPGAAIASSSTSSLSSAAMKVDHELQPQHQHLDAVGCLDNGDTTGTGPAGHTTPGKMFIGGLNWQTTLDGLQSYFGRFGEISECMIMRDPVTKRSRGFGFVTFSNPSSVEKVLAVKVHQLDDKVIDPKVAVPKRTSAVLQPKMVTRTKKLFVGGLSASTTIEDIRGYFEQFGKIEDAMLMFDKVTQRHRVSSDEVMSFSRYLAMLQPLEDKRNHVADMLPPLVPPSYGDEDHFEERQVYTIPRVGKSLDASLHDETASKYAADTARYLQPSSALEGDAAATGSNYSGSESRRYLSAALSGGNRNEGLRQVFSKIPRVGRSVSRTKRRVDNNTDADEPKITFYRASARIVGRNRPSPEEQGTRLPVFQVNESR